MSLKMATIISISTLIPLMRDKNKLFFLPSLLRRGQVNLSTPTFPNINLPKAIGNLLVVSKITEKLLQ